MKRTNDSKDLNGVMQKLGVQLLRRWGVGKISLVLKKLGCLLIHMESLAFLTLEKWRGKAPPEHQKRVRPRKGIPDRTAGTEPLLSHQHMLPLCVPKSSHVFCPSRTKRSHPAL